MLLVVFICLLRDKSYHAFHFLITGHPDRREPDPDALRRILIEELEHFRSLADRLVGGGRRDVRQLMDSPCGLASSGDINHLSLKVGLKLNAGEVQLELQ